MNNVSINKIIDRRIQVRLKEAKQEDWTSIIVLSKDIKNRKLEEAFKNFRAKIKYRLDIINGYAINFPCNCIEKLALISGVDFIADDATLTTLMDVARPVIGGNIANQYKLTGNGIGIGVIDTGVYPHADLALGNNRIIAFKDFVKDYSFPYDDNGHGTHVAGIAAGNGYMSNGKYMGIAPEANIIAIKSMDKNGSGNTSDIVAGLEWLLKNKNKYNIRVVSLSIGSDPDLSESEDPLVKAVNRLWDEGLVVVAAAGNSGPKNETINSPGISKKIITVGSLDDKRTINTRDDTIPSFSSRGPTQEGNMKPDIVAPGVDILSLNSDKKFLPKQGVRRYKFKKMDEPYKNMIGTSMSTPMVSGAIALLLERNPGFTPEQIKTRLINSAISLNANNNAQGYGMINISDIL